ncbi:hypothetical protein [Amycolatopsis sp. 195334CR]|uniref:hypothetical protein n=1 Tax=Amycolatopsis sp. 195334CR TaxID=2814588 RepID=UPI001A90B88F|nr:hypothetical protein [Amycolatopsis sp. 195334CR]MBN6039286.1 hypothetical protein [Amycolatopsis sp. 195334CR]
MKSLTAVVITLVVGLLVALTVVLARQARPDVVVGAAEEYPVYVAPPTVTVPEYVVPPASTVTQSPPATTESALSLLQRQIVADRTAVSALVGSWVPQLSAKQVGLVVRGETFDHRRIWHDYLASKQRYPSALLLWSGDFSSFKHPDFWITVVPERFSTGEAANGWCVDQGIGKDDCYAKRLTHSGGYEGNTLVRK